MTRSALSSHWKFQRLARALESRALARGVLELLWDACRDAGDPYVGTGDDIEAICEWRGARGALTRALVETGQPHHAGFIEPYRGIIPRAREPYYQLHDFSEHCPDSLRPRRCLVCEQKYFASHARSRTCSDRCRQVAHRHKVTVMTDMTVRNEG